MKKIAINTRLLLSGKVGGIEKFTFEVFSRLAKSHLDYTFYYIFDRPYSKEFITSKNIIPIVLYPPARHPLLFYFWFEFAIPRLLRKIKADIFISPDNFNTTSKNVKSLVVIHDLNFEHYPQYLPKLISWYYRKFTPKFVNSAKRIITVSEFSKNDIIKQYGVDENKIDVVYNGVNSRCFKFSDKEKQDWKNENTDAMPFFLFVGTIHPRKNLINQLRAFELFSKKSNIEYKFYIVGDKWIVEDELKQAIDKLNYKQNVIFAGKKNEKELKLIISSASALLYASIFEGFGIPILEGFANETPVITSNISSMPEVAGNSALLVDPFNVEDIANAMHTIVENEDVKNEFIASGLDRYKDFSWEKTVELFWESIIKEI